MLEDAAAQSVAGWATGISAGPTNELLQRLEFKVSSNNDSLFAVLPAVSAAGELTYKLNRDANGEAIVTVSVKDDGGTANSGADTSGSQSFTIKVTAVNDPPSFIRGAGQTVDEDADTQVVANWATAISRGPADEAGQTLTFSVGTDKPLLFSQLQIAADGTLLQYKPAANANGTAKVTVFLGDDGGTDNGGVNVSGLQEFMITVNSVNDEPGPQAQLVTTEEDTAKSIKLTATDIDGPFPLGFAIVSPPAGGSLGLVGPGHVPCRRHVRSDRHLHAEPELQRE